MRKSAVSKSSGLCLFGSLGCFFGFVDLITSETAWDIIATVSWSLYLHAVSESSSESSVSLQWRNFLEKPCTMTIDFSTFCSLYCILSHCICLIFFFFVILGPLKMNDET